MAFGEAKLVDVFASFSQGAKRGYTMILTVEATSVVDSMDPIGPVFAAKVPKIWDTFTTVPFGGAAVDERAFCTSKSPSRQQKKSKRLWYVTCLFETLTREQKKRALHPLDRPAEITDGASIYAVGKHLDINQVPILNGAKQLFNPASQFDEARGIITVTRNLAARLDKRAWINRVNSDAFDVYDPGELKIQDIQQVRRIEEFDEDGDGNPEEVEFWEVSVVFEEMPITTDNPGGWQPSILNAGRKQLKGDGTLDKSDIRDPPWPLTTSGTFVTESSLPGSANYIDVEAYRTAAFSGMGLFA